MATEGDLVRIREELIKGGKTVAEQAGINPRKLRGHNLYVRLIFRGLLSRKYIPAPISDFVAQQYPGREVQIEQIETRLHGLGSDSHVVAGIEVSPVKPLNTLEEARSRFILSPKDESATSSLIYIDVHKTHFRFTTGVARMREVISSRNAPARTEVMGGEPVNPQVILALAGYLPDPTLVRSWFLGRWVYKDGLFNPNKHLTEPIREVATWVL